MGTHLIPRSNVKGQDRFFIIFSIPGLIGTGIGLIPGFIIYTIIKTVFNNGDTYVPGLIAPLITGAIGFAIGQLKIPETGDLPIIKKAGGLYIRDVIFNYLTFKGKRRKYVLQVDDEQEFDEIPVSKLESFILNTKKDKNTK